MNIKALDYVGHDPTTIRATVGNWELEITEDGVQIDNTNDGREAWLRPSHGINDRPFYRYRQGKIPASIENIAVGMIAAFRLGRRC